MRRCSPVAVKMLWIVCLSVLAQSPLVESSVTNCRWTMKAPRGSITTPNFPDPYPVPINCQWVIEAPSDKVIAIYFTQFYMREGLRAAEYAYYSPNVKMGREEFGTISSEREPTYLVSNKPVLVLDFSVRELANIHMRVREYLLDVFGFNITYEFLSKNESVRRDACLYHHCSFTGSCYASAEYDGYYCSCFSKYFGEECQYDAECGPDATRNICLNGGTCRYYIGSTVRTCECPPGYDGARCEAKKLPPPAPKQIECSGPSCNVTCASGKSAAGDDCADKESRVRYVVSLKLTNPKVAGLLSDRRKMDAFKKEMENALFLLFKGRLEVIENITVLEVWSSAIMKFHLLALKEDGEELKSTLEQMLQLGKLGSFDFDHDYQQIHSEPALRIDRMEASEDMPVAEGTELTLACMVQGSGDMRVEWFKDGSPIHVHTAERSMFTTIVPKNSLDQYTALLGFDRVVSLDSGTFTCQVSDWGFVRNSSLYVHVLSAPQPQVSPITATLPAGSLLIVTCLSREDIYGNFGYTWLKNDRVLNPSAEPEMVEDLFPAGSRILLRETHTSAMYSCIITSSAGSTRKDSFITVIDKENPPPTCPAEDYLKVRWTQTAANTRNIQLCPTGYTGDVQRKCSPTPNGHDAVWEEPDFSGCFSGGLVSLKKKVRSLRLGYLISDTGALLSRLKRYLMSKKLKLHFCEGEPIVDVLQDIGSITHGDKRNQDGWTTFLDISSALLESPVLIKKHQKLIQLHQLMFSYGFQYAEKTNSNTFELFERKAVAVHLGRVSDAQHPVQLPAKWHPSAAKYHEGGPRQYTWMTNSVEIDLSNQNIENGEQGNSSASVVAVFYRNLSSHLPQRFYTKKGIADVEYQLISSLVGVDVRGNLNQDNISIRISLSSFNHTLRDKRLGWNISCGMANFKYGTVQFNINHCHLIWTVGNTSICQCHRLGTYALLLTHYALPDVQHIEVSFDAIAGSGCAICAFLLCITILVLSSLWRKLRGAVTALKLQVCLALLGAFGIFFISFLKPISEAYVSYTVPLIQFFLLTAFSLQLCLALVVYIENVELKNVQYSFTKISALGWAIPVIIVGATLAAQSLEGYEHNGWWLTLGSNFFYAYTSSALILTMFQIMLFVIVKTEIQKYSQVAGFLQSHKVRITHNRISLLHRSLLLTSTLLFLSMASILHVNYEKKIYEYFFAINSVLVGVVVLLSYTFCSEKHFLLCCLQENHDAMTEHEDSDVRSGTDAFKSFLKPEIVDDPYSRKMHLDAEKRADRIKRMYSQIERASLSNSVGTPPSDPTTELLDHHYYRQQNSTVEDGPIFKSYQHAAMTNGHLIKEEDAFCDPLDRGDGYPKMHWRYANHPHVLPEGAHKHSREQTNVKRPLLLEPDTQNSQEIAACSQFPGSFSPFPSLKTVKADVTGAGSHSDFLDNAEDECNLKISCLLKQTDSPLETGVHCDAATESEAPLRNIAREFTPAPTPSWNMTTV